MTSFIAAGGSGRSTSVIPAVPAAWSVTTIAFIRHLPASSSRLLAGWIDGDRHRTLARGPPSVKRQMTRRTASPASATAQASSSGLHGSRNARKAEASGLGRGDAGRSIAGDVVLGDHALGGDPH